MSCFARLRHLFLLPCLALSVAAFAQTTRRVPTPNFPTIQAAIDASSTGDTVLVDPGTYFESLSISGKEITLAATGSPANTFLDGSGSSTILRISSTPSLRTTVSGFTFQNGLAAAHGTSAAAVLLVFAGATITHNTFQHNTGPVLFGQNSTLALSSNLISTAPTTGCTISNDGLTLQGGSSLATPTQQPIPSTISGNTFVGDGTACSGNALVLNNGGIDLVTSNILRDSRFGVQITQPGVLSLHQNLIYDNSTGGLAIVLPATLTNTDSDIPPIHITNNTIVNNHTGNPADTGPEVLVQNLQHLTEFVNNILVGTTSGHPVLACIATQPYPTPTLKPLVLDHNDIFNTTRAPGGLVTGTCLSPLNLDLPSALAQGNNLQSDPQLAGSTDLHPLAGSPVLDAGNNSAARLLQVPDPILTPLVPTDSDSNARLADTTGRGTPVVDMGAYERSGTTSTIATALEVDTSDYSGGPSDLHIAIVTLTAADGTVPPGTLTLFANGTALTSAPVNAAGQTTLRYTPAALSGWVAITVTYASQSGYAPALSVVRYIDLGSPGTSTSPATTQTTLSLAASPGTVFTGRPITLSAQLGSSTTSNGTTTSGPVPPGALALSQDGSFLTTLQPEASGLATYTVTQLAPGNHTWTVAYAGSGPYPSASATTTAGVSAPAATAITATIQPSPAPLGDPVTLSATVANTTTPGTTPTGSLSLYDGSTLLATLPLAGGSASVTTSTLSLGTHTITFTYTPDSGFSPATTTRPVTVGGLGTVTHLSASPNPAAAGTTVHLVASVANTGTGPQPQGSLALSDGNTLLVTSPYPTPDGTLAFDLTAVPAGAHALSATFTPATRQWLTSTGTVALTVSPAPVLVSTLSASASSIPFGGDLLLTTTFSSAAPLPVGTRVDIFDNGSLISTQLFSTPSSSFVTGDSNNPALTPGQHTFFETISDASGALLSTTNTIRLTVTQPATSLTLATTPGSTVPAGSAVTLTSQLTHGPLATGTALGGSITFFDGATILGVAPVGTYGITTLTLGSLAPGQHTLSATYTGTLILPAATSAAVTLTITGLPTTTTLRLPGTASPLAPFVVSAHVAAAGSLLSGCTRACSAGTVAFLSGASQLGQAALDPTGTATTTLSLPAGTYALTAVYSGTAFAGGSTSSPATLTIAPLPSTLALAATASSITVGAPVTLSATLAAPGLHPTGTVTFSDGTATLATVPLSSAFAQFTWTAANPIGPHTLAAAFSGDTNTLASSATVAVTVLAVTAPDRDLSLTLAAPSYTIKSTHHVDTTLTLTTTGIFSDTLDLSCPDLPAIAACAFSSAPLRVGANTTASSAPATYTVQLHIDTDFIYNWARNSPSPASPHAAPTGPVQSSLLTPALAALLPASLLCLVPAVRRRRSLPRLLALVLACSLATLSLSACSGREPGHTAPGTYSVHVLAHARGYNMDRSVPFTLIVTE